MDSGVHEQNRPPSAGSVALGASAATYHHHAHQMTHLNPNLHPITRLHDAHSAEVDNRKRAYSVGSKLFGVPFRKLSHGAKYPLAMAEEVTNRLRSGSFGSSSGRGTPHGRMSQELTKAPSSDGGRSEDLMEMHFGPSPPIGRSPSGSIGSCESLTRSRTGSTGASIKIKDGRGIPVASKYTHPPPSNLLRSPSSSFHPENCTIREVESPTQRLEKEIIMGSGINAEEDYLAMGPNTPRKISAGENQTPKLIHSRSNISVHRGADGIESRQEIEKRLAELALQEEKSNKTAEGELPEYINFGAQPEQRKPSASCSTAEYEQMSAPPKQTEEDLYLPMTAGEVNEDAALYEPMQAAPKAKPTNLKSPLSVMIPREGDRKGLADVKRKSSKDNLSAGPSSPRLMSGSLSPTSPRFRKTSDISTPTTIRTQSFSTTSGGGPKSPKVKSSFAKFFSPIIGKIQKNSGSTTTVDIPKASISSRPGSNSNSNSASSWIPAEAVSMRGKAMSISGRRPDSESSACSMHLAEPSTSFRDSTSGGKLEMDVVVSYLMDESEDEDQPPLKVAEPKPTTIKCHQQPTSATPASRTSGGAQHLLQPASLASRRDLTSGRKYSEPCAGGVVRKTNLSPSEKLLQEENLASGKISQTGTAHRDTSSTQQKLSCDSRIRSSSGSARLVSGESLEYATLDLPETSGAGSSGDRSPSPQILPAGNKPDFHNVGSLQRLSSDSSGQQTATEQTVYASIDPRKSEGLRKSSRKT